MRDCLTEGNVRKFAGLGAAALLLVAAVGAAAQPILPPPEGQPVPRANTAPAGLPPAPTAKDLAPGAEDQPKDTTYKLPRANVFYTGTVKQADLYAKATNKLLVVDLRAACEPHYELTGTRTLPFEHRTTAAWILQHAILAKATQREAEVILAAIGHEKFNVEGLCMAVFCRNELVWPTPLFRKVNLLTGKPMERFYTAIGVLGVLEFTRERTAARDPIWAAAHERDNPPLAAPDPGPPLHRREGEYAAKIEPLAPLDVDGVATTIVRYDVLERILRAGDERTRLFEAAGLWTWAVEAAAGHDPDVEPGLWSAGVANMTKVAQQSATVRTQLRLLRNATSPMLPWADFPGVFRWASVCAAIGERSATVLELDERYGDIDEQTMLPRTWNRAYELMISRLDAVTVAEPPEKGLRWLASQAEKIRAGEPKVNGAKDLAALRVWLFEVEACRVMTAALRTGEEGRAMEVVQLAVACRGEGMKRKLAMAAVIAGTTRPMMAGWLAEGDPVRKYIASEQPSAGK